MIKVKTFPITTWFIVLCLNIVNCQDPNKGVTVKPETYVDDKKPYMEFTCETHLDKGDTLSWSMMRNKKQETLALYQERYENGTKELNLQWPLSPEDNKTEIFCSKEKTVNGKPATTKSKNIPISFQKAGPKSGEKLWVSPRKSVIIYDLTTPVELDCWAWLDTTRTIDQFVVWYQIFGASRPERIAIMPQMNNRSYVKNTLKRFFKPMDSRTQIFCGNETILANLSNIIGLKSDRILLIHNDDPDTTSDVQVTDECGILRKLGWMVTAVLVVLAALAMVGLAFAFVILCFGTKLCKSSNKSKSI